MAKTYEGELIGRREGRAQARERVATDSPQKIRESKLSLALKGSLYAISTVALIAGAMHEYRELQVSGFIEKAASLFQ